MFGFFPTELRSSQLRVLSSIFSNIAAGFLLLAIAAKDLWVLTGDVVFGILFTLLAITIEDILEETYD